MPEIDQHINLIVSVSFSKLAEISEEWNLKSLNVFQKENDFLNEKQPRGVGSQTKSTMACAEQRKCSSLTNFVGKTFRRQKKLRYFSPTNFLPIR